MTIKDMQYYRDFDLSSAAMAIHKLADKRGTSPVFGDAIQSLWVLSEESEVTAEKLCDVLGKPDRVRATEAGNVWEYDWIDQYGQITYASSTPFLIVNGVVQGLADEE